MQISFYISGNKHSNEGFSALLISGTSRNIPDGVVPGFESNAEYYIVQNTPTDTLFTIVNNRVSSVGAARTGLLKMAVAIPAGYRLAGGVSPHTLLRELYSLYMSRYMRSGFSGAQFSEESERLEVFQPILARYPLEASPRPVRPGSGMSRACVVADEATTAQLFLDTAYPEFQSYAEVIVAGINASALPVLSVPIPRQPLYTVILNGRRCGTINPAVSAVFSLQEKPADKYSAPISENIDVNKARRGEVKGVVVNDAEETITCHIPFRPLRKLCRLSLRGMQVDLTQCYLKSGHLYKPVSADGTVELVGEEIDKSWSVEHRGGMYKFTDVTATVGPDGVGLFTATVERKAGGAPSRSSRKSSGVSPVVLWIAGCLICLLLGLGTGYLLWGLDNGESRPAVRNGAGGPDENKNPESDESGKKEEDKRTPEEKQYHAYLEALRGTDFLLKEDLDAIVDFLETDKAKEIEKTFENEPARRLSDRYKVYQELAAKLNILDVASINKWITDPDNPRGFTNPQIKQLNILCEIKDKNRVNRFNGKIKKLSDIERLNDTFEGNGGGGSTPAPKNDEKKTTKPKSKIKEKKSKKENERSNPAPSKEDGPRAINRDK